MSQEDTSIHEMNPLIRQNNSRVRGCYLRPFVWLVQAGCSGIFAHVVRSRPQYLHAHAFSTPCRVQAQPALLTGFARLDMAQGCPARASSTHRFVKVDDGRQIYCTQTIAFARGRKAALCF